MLTNKINQLVNHINFTNRFFVFAYNWPKYLKLIINYLYGMVKNHWPLACNNGG